jgi:hypothetical protein
MTYTLALRRLFLENSIFHFGVGKWDHLLTGSNFLLVLIYIFFRYTMIAIVGFAVSGGLIFLYMDHSSQKSVSSVLDCTTGLTSKNRGEERN